MPPDWKNLKKQLFICSNLTLSIDPFFFIFIFFLFLFFFLFFFFLFPRREDGPQPPSNDAPEQGEQSWIEKIFTNCIFHTQLPIIGELV
jgi:hypothetical protein